MIINKYLLIINYFKKERFNYDIILWKRLINFNRIFNDIYSLEQNENEEQNENNNIIITTENKYLLLFKNNYYYFIF